MLEILPGKYLLIGTCSDMRWTITDITYIAYLAVILSVGGGGLEKSGFTRSNMPVPAIKITKVCKFKI